MGYSLSWAAVRDGNADAIHSLLCLRATDSWEEIPESEIVGINLPAGWYVVVFNKKELKDDTLKQLSSLGEVVYCFVEDHVMFSRASSWKNGQLVWSVTHNSERGRYDLDIYGAVPSPFEDIRRNLTAQQDAEGKDEAEVDYIYDVPATVAKELTGFRHDEEPPGRKGEVFQVLELLANNRSFLQRFLARD